MLILAFEMYLGLPERQLRMEIGGEYILRQPQTVPPP